MQRGKQGRIRLIVLISLVVLINGFNDTSCASQTIWGCSACPLGNYTSFNVNTSLYTCADKANCAQVNSTKDCIKCQPNFMMINQLCYPMIQNCLNYTVDSASNTSQCTQCTEGFMTLPNCQVNINYCQRFNYVTGICQVCNRTGQFMDESRKFCTKFIPNCLIYAFDGCAQCQQQYTINSLNKSQCVISFTIGYQLQTKSLNPTTQKVQTKVTTLCLQNNFYYDTVNCIQAKSTFIISSGTYISYECKVFDLTKTLCAQCIDGFYLFDSICTDCAIAINNCLACTYSCTTSPCKPNCTICEPTHYSFLSQGQYICRQCSTYGCQKCKTDQNQAIVCTQCERGKTLFNSTCYSCPQGFQLSLTTLECISCPSNCANCSNGICTWCSQNYTRIANNTCVLISTLTTSGSITSSTTINEILSKAFPNQQNLIYNNQVELMSSCVGQATRFSCICASNSSSLISSMCYSLTQVSKYDFSKVFALPITNQIFLANSQTLRLMAQLPSFDSLDFSMDFTSTSAKVLFPQDKIASLLEIYVQVLRRQNLPSTASNLKTRLLPVNTTLTLQQLFNIAEYSFKDSLSRSSTTVIYGNGYFMKYYPGVTPLTDTDSFIKVEGRSSSQPLFIFVWFDNLNSSKSLTGTIYAYTSSSPYQITVSIQQIFYPSTTFSYVLYENDAKSIITIQKTSTNTLSFAIKTSTATALNSYNVEYVETSAIDVNNLFNSQRIEFIFYQSAFIYILVFLVAYLFLIPCCALLDFISPKRAQHRKRVRSQDFSLNHQGKQANSEDNSSSHQTIQISVNYKDFFPIYNICNTPRPKRILKLCLFLLNMQHGITFLTLIYFGLGAGHPVVAVVIGIPAYFGTIIMGYICGVLTIVIPGWFKYMINLFVLGYWVLWVAFMPIFSSEYQPYVIIFAVVFFVIDLVIDSLEMFMVYFSIIKSQKQTKMFECLASWLSKRGYYEYNELANQMHDDNS